MDHSEDLQGRCARRDGLSAVPCSFYAFWEVATPSGSGLILGLVSKSIEPGQSFQACLTDPDSSLSVI